MPVSAGPRYSGGRDNYSSFASPPRRESFNARNPVPKFNSSMSVPLYTPPVPLSAPSVSDMGLQRAPVVAFQPRTTSAKTPRFRFRVVSYARFFAELGLFWTDWGARSSSICTQDSTYVKSGKKVGITPPTYK